MLVRYAAVGPIKQRDRGLGAGALLATWLHQLAALTAGEDIVAGNGVGGCKAMTATLRRIVSIPRRLIRHARHLILRLPPGHGLLAEILARLWALPALR